MSKYLFHLMFWQCYCYDALHFGDNPNCPKHSLAAFITRFLLIAILAVVAFLILATANG